MASDHSSVPQGCGPPPQISSYLGWPTSLKIPRSRRSPQFAQDLDDDQLTTSSCPARVPDSTPESFPMATAASAPPGYYNRSSTSSTASSLSSVSVTTPDSSNYKHDFFPSRPYTSPPNSLVAEEIMQSVGVVTERTKYVLLISLPKFLKDDITLSARRTKTLHIVADKYDDQGGHFERKITFGRDADFSSISADFDGNVLVVTVPRREIFVDVPPPPVGLGLTNSSSTSSTDYATVMPQAQLSDWSLDRFWAAAAKATAHDWKIVEEYAALTSMSLREERERQFSAIAARRKALRDGSPCSASDSPSTSSPPLADTPSSLEEAHDHQWRGDAKSHFRGVKEALQEEQESNDMDGMEIERQPPSSQDADSGMIDGPTTSSMDCSEDYPHETDHPASISPSHEVTVALSTGMSLSPPSSTIAEHRGRRAAKLPADAPANVISSSIPSHMRFGTTTRHTRSRSRTGIRHTSLPPTPSSAPTESLAGDTVVSDGEGSSMQEDSKCLSRQVSFDESPSLASVLEKEEGRVWMTPKGTGSPASTPTRMEVTGEMVRPCLARSTSSALGLGLKVPTPTPPREKGPEPSGRKSPFWKRWTDREKGS